MHKGSVKCASKLFLLLILVGIFLMPVSKCFSQTLTDTFPHNKNAVIEEFTAVRCSFCPTGHALLDSIINENSGRVIPVAMYPSNVSGSLTLPYTGSPDLRRTFVNEFFTMPFVHDSVRFFPGSFINRRQWRPAKRAQFRDKWRSCTDTILNELSPVNIGISSVYNATSSILDVDVEVYFTDTVNSLCTLFVVLTEDSLIAEQLNGGVNYIHNHVFRESLTAQWGDILCLQANKGALFTKHYIFDNTVQQYFMQHSHIAAYVRNASDEEIITGAILATDNIIVSTNEHESVEPNIQLFPNPTDGIVNIACEKINKSRCLVEIYNVSSVLCYSDKIIFNRSQQLDLSSLKKGIYFIRIRTDEHIFVRKLNIE